jgi:protein phosphatase
MTWQFGTASDIGGRAEQQDRVDVIASPDGERYLLVVADGMGGYEGGALAAQAVVDAAERFFETESLDDPLAALRELCAEAHQAVVEVESESAQPP